MVCLYQNERFKFVKLIRHVSFCKPRFYGINYRFVAVYPYRRILQFVGKWWLDIIKFINCEMVVVLMCVEKVLECGKVKAVAY